LREEATLTTRTKTKTLLDLLGEFARLNDEKAGFGGTLPPEKEARWSELKGLYDLLMAEASLHDRMTSRRFERSDIQEQLGSHDRLRVPAELDMIVRHEGNYLSMKAVNISRGGLFVTSDELYPVGSRLTVMIANTGRGHEAVFEAESEVVWVSDGRDAGFPRGMGIRFDGSRESIQRQLDRFVIDTLEKRLQCIDTSLLPPDFIEKENLDL